jgi:hypothetical protein
LLETSSFGAFQCFEVCDGNPEVGLSGKHGEVSNDRRGKQLTDLEKFRLRRHDRGDEWRAPSPMVLLADEIAILHYTLWVVLIANSRFCHKMLEGSARKGYTARTALG